MKGGTNVSGRNKENYSADEYKSYDEYKYFKAEQYVKTVDYNPTPDENAVTGPETRFGNYSDTTVVTKKKTDDTQKSQRQKFLDSFEKLKKSLSSLGGSVVGSVAVAAAAIIVCVTLFITPPSTDHFSFECDYNIISFAMEIGDINPEVDYDIVLYNENERYVISEVFEGAFEGKFENLTPKTDYTLALIGNTQNGIEEYLTKSVYTLPSIPIINSFVTVATYNKISISLDLENYDSDVSYYLVLSDGSEILLDKSNNSYAFEKLLPSTGYSVSLIGKYRDNTISYEQASFETLKEFDGSINAPSLIGSTINWNEDSNEITIPFSFDGGSSDGYKYAVILTDESNTQLGYYLGNESNPVFLLPTESEKINVKYQLAFEQNESVIVCESYDLGVLDISKPKIQLLNDKELSGISRYKIPLNVSSKRFDSLYQNSILYYTVSYDGIEQYTSEAYDWEVNTSSFIEIELPTGVSQFSVALSLEYTEKYGKNQRTVVSDNFSYTNELEFALIDAYADLSYYGGNTGYLYFGYYAPEGSYVLVTPEGEEGVILESDHYEFTTEGVHNFTYQLFDLNNTPLSEMREISFDVTFNQEYNFYSANPGEIIVTSNDDETINLYIDVQFESENPDIFYKITYGNNVFISKDYLAVIKNVPNQSYPITYQVIYEKNGVRYILSSTTPSGTVDTSFDYTFELFENEENVVISASYPLNFMPNSSIIIRLNEKELEVSQDDIVFNESTYTYDIVLDYTEEILYADISFRATTIDSALYDELVSRYGDLIEGSYYIKVTKILK